MRAANAESNGLPPYVESYKKVRSKVALRVSVETLGVAAALRYKREEAIRVALKSNITAKSSDLPPHVESYKKVSPKVALRVSVETLGVAAALRYKREETIRVAVS